MGKLVNVKLTTLSKAESITNWDEEYPKNIQLFKVETREDAEVDQELKYPSGTIIKEGLMWEHTLPKVGDQFYVYVGKLYPSFHTSTVVEINSVDMNKGVVAFKTKNSKYEIRWYDEAGN